MKSNIGPSSSSGQPRLHLGASGDGFDSAVNDRVRLYLKVTFFINLAFASTSFIIHFLDPAMRIPPVNKLVMMAVTSVNGLAWFLVSQNRWSFSGTPVVANVITIVITMMYSFVVHISINDPSIATDLNPTRMGFFLILIVNFLLVLRSSLIPSRTVITAIVGAFAIAMPLIGFREYIEIDLVFFVWFSLSGFIVVAVTTVTSSTIYGLNRQMAAAAQLGQYQIERLLGRGGMGEVYLAKHALLQRPTAIKLLRDVSSVEMRDLFRREVQTASGLTHPNTVEILDYGRTPEGIFYFAMEYVEGATLADVVRSTGAMPESRVVHLLDQAAGALAEAHSRGLVHRDVKPSNLMLCERGGVFDTLKVMDFGLVLDLADMGDTVQVGLVGTPLYLAPETILDPETVSPQSDVYALGATAYFLLTGQPAFSGETLVEILSDHLATLPPAPPAEDAVLANLIRQCLAKDPADRPADAQAFADALRECRDYGEWTKHDADIWWSEHREVVEAHKPDPSSMTGHSSNSRSRSRRSTHSET